MRWQARLVELRTALTGLDPGLARLRLAAIATASMVLAAGAMSAIRAATGLSITVVLLAAVLGMFSNLSVTEPDLDRRRITTMLMVFPAAAAIVAGTLLASHRILADAVFVVVIMVAVYVRRFGPRGFALGMAAFIPYFFTQFLNATVSELGWLLAATGVGIGSTLLLGGWMFPERSDRLLRRLLRAFRAHLHALVEAVRGVLAITGSAPGGPEEMLGDVRRRRIRLNQTALLVADRLEPRDGAGSTAALGEGAKQTLTLRLLDAELSAERLAVATERLLQGPETLSEVTRRSLLGGLRCLSAASATGTPPAAVGVLLKDARQSVDDLVAETHGYGDRTQRVGLAVVRLAEAMEWVSCIDGSPPGAGSSASAGSASATMADGAGESCADSEPRAGEDPEPGGLQLTTRQAIQAGVATGLAIVVGELLSPSRWYWAVIAAFVVFAGTTSRGDVLNRGLQRIVGTIGGVLAGMGLAVLVGPHHQVALILLACCVFLAMYLVRVSQTLMAFWITAVLALLYGLIGQFSVQTLVLRIEETAAGAVLGMLAGYLILPKRTQEAFGEALDEMVDTADSVVTTSIDQVLGRATGTGAVSLARDMGSALETLRARAEPLSSPLPRRRFRTSYQRALGVLSGVDYYARSLARVSDTVRDPGWTAALEPAVRGVRANLDGLRHLLLRRTPPQRIQSAEAAVDAAEVYAVRADCARRAGLLTITRLLRRIDQAVVGFASDIDRVTG